MNCPLKRFLAPYQAQILSLLRLVAAYAFFLHGTAKVFGFPISMGNAPFNWASLMGVAAALELVGGALLFVGLFTRPVAFLLSGQMAVAYFMAHFSLYPLAKGGEAALLFSLVFLYFASAGGGAWSLDRLCCRSHA